MKKITLIFAFIAILSAPAVMAQNVGLYAGTNLANMKYSTTDTTATNDMKISYMGGLSMEYVMVDETFYIQLNLEAMGKGSNITDQDTIYKTSIHMAQAAVGPKYKAKFGYANNWFIGAYGYVGYSYLGTTKAEGHDDYELSFGTDPAKNDMNGIDYGVAFDTGFGFSGFNIGYRYNLPLANVSLWDGVKGVHTSQNIYLAYYFSQD